MKFQIRLFFLKGQLLMFEFIYHTIILLALRLCCVGRSVVPRK